MTKRPRPCLLFAEDFDEPPPAAPPVAPAAMLPALLYTEADLQEACAAATRAAQEDAQLALSTHQEAVRTALAAIAASLDDARDAAVQRAERAAAALAQTLLGMVRTALPALCARHAAPELRAVLAALQPALANEARICVELAPATLVALEHDLAALGAALPGEFVLRSNPLRAPGDIEIAWQDGGASRDTRAVLVAIDAALGVGLLDVMEDAHAA